MSGANHGAITFAEELIAFVDGEAPAPVGEAIRSDPTLRTAADGYARTQRHLQERLYRFECPSPQLLGEYDLGLLAPAERTRIVAHVVACPRCAAELRMFGGFLAEDNAAADCRALGGGRAGSSRRCYPRRRSPRRTRACAVRRTRQPAPTRQPT